MTWRFKASKYKNATPIVPKPEACIRDICVGSYQTYGNNICASASVMAFNWEHVGSSLAILPLEDCGRKSKTMPLLHAHTDTITDMEFSPFHDGLLATGSQDCLVKIWNIPPNGLSESMTNAECSLSQRQRRVETVGFNPSADGLLHVTSATVLSLWDLITQQETFCNNDHGDVIQSASWRRDGRIMATSSKDKKVRIIDPRASVPLVSSAPSHQSIKDSRVVWLGDQNRILTTGFDSARLRQVIIRDVRNLSTPEKTLELDCSTGVLMPLYDPDTCMLFLAGKGDTTIAYMEVADRDPFLIEGIRHSGEQTKGACLVPKRALKVMEGEVNRVLQLTSSMVVPIMYQVPRKTYRDFHADLYPNTPGFVTHTNSTMWLKGVDHPVPKISLEPAKRGPQSSEKVHRGPLTQYVKQLEAMVDPTPKSSKPINSPPTALIKPQPKVLPLVEQPDIVKDSEQASRIDFVNVKDLIKGMEKPKQDEKISKRIENQEKNLINQLPPIEKKQPPVVNEVAPYDCDIIDSNDMPESDQNNVPAPEFEELITIAEINNENGDNDHKSNGVSDDDKVCNITQNGSNGSSALAPKPMPRSSISEGGAGEEAYSNVNVVNGVPRPVARPRTTAQTSVSGYKPRLGPKPFSSSQGSEEFSFDKVFSVPAAPGSGTVGQGDQTDCTKTEDIAEGNISPVKHSDSPTKGILNIVSTTPKDSSNSDSFASGEKSSPASDAEATPKDGEYTNGKSDNSVEEEANSSDSGYKPKTPSTAERRKMFEVKTNSKETPDTCVTDDAFDDGKNFERSGNQRASIAERRRLYENRSMSVQETASTGMIAASAAAAVAEVNQPSPTPLRRRDSLKSRRSPEPEEKRASVVNPSTKRTSTVFGRVSKFRHLKGTPGHKSTHIENLKNISRQISGECDGFHANSQRVAVPLGGGGGRVAVLELSATGRLADGVTPALLHPNALCDWQWDPFQDARLLVACDDGIVREWIIPEGGLTEPTNSPARSWAAHSDKIYLLKFHPCASDVVATAAHDFSVKLWDLSTDDVTEKILLTGHKDQIFALAWSPCGTKLATVSKDGLIRIYQPRSSDAPIKEGKGPVGSRGARIVWALNGTHVVVTGFDKVSERQIMLFNTSDLSAPLNTIGLDVSPAILIPFYDEDSSTLFVTGRGDSTIYCFEVTGEAPHLCALSHHRCASLHQGLSFLPKGKCAVEIVEFAKGFRLTNATIEPLSFAVPRIKSELFQDDLFPPTRVSWEPTVTSVEWFKGIDKAPRLISLKPPGMDTLSASVNPVAQSPAGVTSAPAIKPSGFSGNQPFNRLGWNPDMAGITKAKQDEIQRSLAARIEIDMTLEQDSMEGVDESEWDQ